jgi:hypothetical protein
VAHRSAGIAADEHHHRRADRLPRRQLLLPRRRRRADRSVNGRMVLSQRRHRSARFDLPQPCPLRPLSARGLCPHPPQRTGLRRDRRTPDDGRVSHRPARHGPARSPTGHAAGRGGRSLGRGWHRIGRIRCRLDRASRRFDPRPAPGRPRPATSPAHSLPLPNSSCAVRTGRRSSPRRWCWPSATSPAPNPRSAPGWPRSPNAAAACTCRRVCRQRPPSPRWPPATVSSSAAWG